jgi:hypothetical protein
MYIISLLAFRLQDEGHTVLTSSGAYTPDSSTEKVIQSQIRATNFFIGLITRTGEHNDRVYSEWQYAQESGTPGFLLIEGDTFRQGVGPNIVRFDRNDPSPAIQYIIDQQNLWRPKIEAPGSNSGDALAWVIGGRTAIRALELLTAGAK